MKKLLCLLVCIVLMLSAAACGEKEENGAEVQPPEVSADEPTRKIEGIAEAAKSDNIDIGKSRETVGELKEELEKKDESIKENGATDDEKIKYQNEQLAVAIMEMALDDLEKAKESGDADAQKDALDNIEMAKSIWSWDGKTE